MRIAVLLAAAALSASSMSALALAQSAPAGSVSKVTLIVDRAVGPAGRYGVDKLEAALRARGITVAKGGDKLADANLVLVIGPAGAGAAATELKNGHLAAPTAAEGLTVQTGVKYGGKPAILVAGADDTGVMYATLDMADRVGWTKAGSNPFTFVRSVSEKPDLAERGVVMFTMNQAYFESRLLDEQYWQRYFDMMARNRLNRLTLTFGYEDGGYVSPLYPYFFDVDGYPDIKVVGLSKEKQARNLATLKRVFQLARERGIKVKPGIWEHIYRGGGQKGKNGWASDGLAPTPGLVWGVTTENLVPYTVAALKKFHETFPEVEEVQFRLHNESGLLTSEVPSFWHEVFKFYQDNRPNVRLEFRAKGLPKSVIRDAQAHGLKVKIDTKIWMEQMGLPYHPTHINRGDQSSARHSYADLLEYPQTYKMNWTLWNGGTTRLLLWSDPAYARRLVESAHLYDGDTLFVTEMEATKMLGLPHDAKVREFLNPQYRYVDYAFERYWAFYRVFGRLAYNPQSGDELWQHEYAARFGAEAAPHAEKAIELASQVLPHVVAASVPYTIFPTTAGWPEMMHVGSLPEYAANEEGSDIEQFLNVREEAANLLSGATTTMRRPEEMSRWFADLSRQILAEVAATEQALHGQPPGKELASTLTDAKMLAAMARYHSWRQLGGVNYNLYKQTGDLAALDAAIGNERNAVQAWRDLVNAAGDFYSKDIWFGPEGRAFPHHWSDELAKLETEFAALEAERRAAPATPPSRKAPIATAAAPVTMPTVSFPAQDAPTASVGKDYVVKVQASAASGIQSVRLRYRHLNQTEDYQTVPMVRSGTSDTYTASIPAGFVDPKWALMYFVEVLDKKGNGRNYPDLEERQPYYVVNVRQ